MDGNLHDSELDRLLNSFSDSENGQMDIEFDEMRAFKSERRRRDKSRG